MQHWLSLEREGGDAQSIQRVFRLLPKKIKKRKTAKNINGVEEVTEILTYVFPDDESSAAVRVPSRMFKSISNPMYGR